MKLSTLRKTGHQLITVLDAEIERHESAKEAIAEAASKRHETVLDRLAELEQEAKAIRSLLNKVL